MNLPIVILGCQGAGKSSLVNALLGGEHAKVEPNMLKDGTAVVTVHHGHYDIIDTPGLNSSYTLSGPQIANELSQLKSSKFLTLLVLDASTTRFNGAERDKLTKIVIDMNNVQLKVIVVWSKCGLLKEPNIEGKVTELQSGNFFRGEKIFGNAATPYFTTENIGEHLPQLMKDNFYVSMSEVKVKLSKPSGANAVAGAAVRNTAPTKPDLPPMDGSISGRLRHMMQPVSLEPSRPSKNFVKLVKNVLAVRKNSPDDYRVAKMLGDSLIKIAAIFHCLRTRPSNIAEGLDVAINKYINNSEEGAMFKFQECIPELNETPLRGTLEPNHLNAHTKVDFVEALLYYAFAGSNDYNLAHILSGIFKN
jgi:GTPase SAR1 family protein